MASGPLADKKVKKALTEYVTVVVNCDDEKAVAQRYRVSKLPKMVLLTPSGIVFDSSAGLATKEALLKQYEGGYMARGKAVEEEFLKLQKAAEEGKLAALQELSTFLLAKGNLLEGSEVLLRIRDSKAADLPIRIRSGTKAAESLLLIGRFERSVSESRTTIKLAPGKASVSKTLFMVGYAYENWKKRSKAIAAYRDVLKSYPGTRVAKIAQSRITALGG